MKINSIKLIVTIVAIFIVKDSYSQLEIDISQTPKYLVENVLLNKNTPLEIQNVTYRGTTKSIGLFNNEAHIFIPKGIILSTGNVFDARGPNDSPNTGSQMYNDSDTDLDKIARGRTFDPAVLEFDFISSTDSISFNFFFASEEYPEYVKKGVNDVFAFYLINEELNIKKNLAVLETNGMEISVDNINAYSNREFYIENGRWNPDKLLEWEEKKDSAERAFYFQFDGFTKLLRVGSKVIPNKKYHLKIAIADVGDQFYDSAVFLQSGSLKSSGKPPIEDKNNITKKIISNSEIKLLLAKDTAISKNLNIEFKFDSDIITGIISFEILEELFSVLKNEKNIKVKINGHTDNIGKTEYNKELSLKRAKRVNDYLLSKGIEKNRLEFFGFGDTKPLVKNTDEKQRALNRRVEFIFRAK